jgi:hypothetical protein
VDWMYMGQDRRSDELLGVGIRRSGPLRYREFLDWLQTYWLLKTDCSME